MASARATTAAVEDVSASVAGASSSTWDRISSWASDNKVAAWTIAGVTVVVSLLGLLLIGAGVGAGA